jgi:glycerol-3-phosphate dehydrogenase
VDIFIIGGGATGLGAALDAAVRGHSVALVERDDFAAGTSSRSTKLVHGGVRYLRQGQVSLVRESLRERGRLLKNAPGLVHKLNFVIPCRKAWEKPYYGMGMATYDMLAGQFGWEHSRLLSRAETLQRLPGLSAEHLYGGVEYLDGQFNDSRLALALARTAANVGAVILNHAEVVELKRENGRVTGAIVQDRLPGTNANAIGRSRTVEISARVVISAAGVFSDDLARLDTANAPERVAAAQGAHIVLDRSFFSGDSALMVPKTDDGRVLFMIPWQQHLLVGTTDTPVPKPTREPVPLKEEIDYLLEYAGRYLVKKPGRADIKSQFAGLRPLVKPARGMKNTAAVSRDHQIFRSDSGLVTILGGKWTTYRQMAQDVVDKAQQWGGLKPLACKTTDLRLDEGADAADYDHSAELASDMICPELQLTRAMVWRMVRDEMAETVADVLARRSRALFLESAAALRAAGPVAEILAEAKGWPAAVKEQETADFKDLAAGYLAGSA